MGGMIVELKYINVARNLLILFKRYHDIASEIADGEL